METIGPVDVTPFEPTTSAHPVELLQRPAQGRGARRRAARRRTTRAAALPVDLVLRHVASSRRSRTTRIRPVGDQPRPHVHVLHRAGRLPVRLRPELHDVRLLEPAASTTRRRTPTTRSSQRRRHEHGRDVAGTDDRRSSTSTTPDADASPQRPLKRLEGFQKVYARRRRDEDRDPARSRSPTSRSSTEAGERWSVDQGRYGLQIAQLERRRRHRGAGHDQRARRADAEADVVTAKPAIGRATRRATSPARDVPRAAPTIDPHLTVAMNDDTLYGCDSTRHEQGRSRTGMTLSYASNRPGVVAVDGDGRSARSPTAPRRSPRPRPTTASRSRRASSCGSSPLLGDLARQRQVARRDFNAGRARLRRRPARRRRDPPVVAATSADRRHASSSTQADGVPGAATVTVTGADGDAQTYTVNFAPPGARRRVQRRRPGPQWSWVRTRQRRLRRAPGALQITTEPGDLSQRRRARPTRRRTSSLQPALGDWTIETKLTSARPDAANQQGGLIAYQDDDDYLKFDLRVPANAGGRAADRDQRGQPLLLRHGLRRRAGGPVSQTLATRAAGRRSPSRPGPCGCGCRRRARAIACGTRSTASSSPRSTRRVRR